MKSQKQPVKLVQKKKKKAMHLSEFGVAQQRSYTGSKQLPVLHLPEPSRVCTQFSVPTVGLPGSALFSAAEYPINPGYTAMWARVADIAKAFTFWRFKSLTLQWVPTGSAFAATTQTGQVSLSWKVDPTQARADSFAAATVAPVAVGDAWEGFELVVPKKYLTTGGYKDGWRYTTSNDISTANAPMDEAVGLIEICVEGSPGTGTIGRVLLVGEVEFDIPSVQAITTPVKQNIVNCAHTGTEQILTSGVNTDVAGGGLVLLPSALLTGSSFLSSPFRIVLGTGTFKIEIFGKLTFTTATAIASNLVSEPSALFNLNEGYVDGSAQSFGKSFYYQDIICVANGAGLQPAFAVNINVTGTGTIRLTAFSAVVTNVY